MIYLASDAASFTNGEIITMDGGLSLTTDKYDDFIDDLNKGALYQEWRIKQSFVIMHA